MNQEKVASSPDTIEAGNWRWWAIRLLAGVVGVVLLTAGVLKATDMEVFIRQLKDFQIISGRIPLALTAWGLIALECTLGVGLILFHRPRFILALTLGLLLVFMGAVGWAWATGLTEDCGCFGSWAQRTPAEAFIEDLLLLAATALAWIGQRRMPAAPSRVKGWAITTAFLAGLVLPMVFGFPIQAISQPQSKTTGVDLGDLKVEGLDQIDLSRGEYLLILIDTDCSHCQDAVPEMNALSQSTDLPPLLAVCKNDELKRMVFTEQYQSTFPIGQISEDDFWRLLDTGDTPRTMFVRDHRIEQVWNQTIPSQDAIGAARNK